MPNLKKEIKAGRELSNSKSIFTRNLLISLWMAKSDHQNCLLKPLINKKMPLTELSQV
jgi:hypothetical protein